MKREKNAVELWLISDSHHKNQLADEATLLKFQEYRNISVMLEAYPEWVKPGYPVETNRQ